MMPDLGCFRTYPLGDVDHTGRRILQVPVFGENVTKRPTHQRVARGMARTFQVTTLFPKLTVLDNVCWLSRGCGA
jgi:ABC-type branched-subunit amino acid transport system ATPase component